MPGSMTIHNVTLDFRTLRQNFVTLEFKGRIQHSTEPVSGPATPGVKRFIQPDPENGARGSNHGILG